MTNDKASALPDKIWQAGRGGSNQAQSPNDKTKI